MLPGLFHGLKYILMIGMTIQLKPRILMFFYFYFRSHAPTTSVVRWCTYSDSKVIVVKTYFVGNVSDDRGRFYGTKANRTISVRYRSENVIFFFLNLIGTYR